MKNEYDDMNCCSQYFYIRYAGENTLIDLSMATDSHPAVNDQGLSLEIDRPLSKRLCELFKSHSFWFRTFFSIVFIMISAFLVIYVYNYFYIQPNSSDPNHLKPT